MQMAMRQQLVLTSARQHLPMRIVQLTSAASVNIPCRLPATGVNDTASQTHQPVDLQPLSICPVRMLTWQ
jgi:hypothetical protein